MTPSPENKKSIMRSLGEFFGHIVKGVQTDVEKPETTTVEKTVKETTEGNVTYRETVIREVEVRKPTGTDESSSSSSSSSS